MGLASKLAASQQQQQGGGVPPPPQSGQQSRQQQPPPPPQAQGQGQQQMYGYGQPPQQPYGQPPQQNNYGAPPPAAPYGGAQGYGAPPHGPPQGYPPQQSHYPGQQHHGHYPPPQRNIPPQHQQQPPPPPPPQQQQQQQHGGGPPPPMRPPQGGPGQGGQQAPPQPQQHQANEYLRLLDAAVKENGLQAYYPPQRIQQLASMIGPQVQAIAQAWQIPMELAVDLTRLALYDIVLFCDDSGSMSFEENGERIDDLKLILQRCSYAASLFDTDGIEVRFMNGNQMGNNIRTDQQVSQLLSQTKFHGLTPLGTSLKSKVLDPMVVGPARSGRMEKPVLVISITDGHPAGENNSTVFKVIRETKHQLSKTRYGPGGVAFQFAQVGNDLKARDFLAKLDTDRDVGGLVDCTSTFEVEQDEMSRLGVDLTPSAWLVKLMMGAIDRSYDEQDEAR